MASDILLIDKKEHVTTIVLNRPEKRNSLLPELLMGLSREIGKLKNDGVTRALIIRGAGDKAFSSGFDISSLPTSGAPDHQDRFKKQNPFENALQDVSNFPYPVIAMLNGYAYGGGCELAVSCDLRVGAEGISIGMPPAKMGLVYSANGLMRFVRLLGFAKTKEVFFTGRYYGADRAKEMGLIDYIVPKLELEEFTFRLAAEIAGNPPLAVKGTKRILGMLAESFHLTEAQLQEARSIVEQSFNSEDLKEAQTAFLEKREPLFKGR